MTESEETLFDILCELTLLKDYIEENHTSQLGPYIHNAIRIMKEQERTIQELEKERRRTADALRKCG